MSDARIGQGKKHASVRINILFVLFLCAALAIAGKLAMVQIPEYVQRAATAVGSGEREENPLERGEFFLTDRHGTLTPLAANTDLFTIFVDPRMMSDEATVAHALAEALHIPADTIAAKIAKRDDPYEVIATRVPENVADGIRARNISGVGFTAERGRSYPYRAAAAHLSGFLNLGFDPPRGQYGLEEWYNDALGRVSGSRRVEQMVLSVDPDVQFVVTDALTDVVARFQATGGSGIVLEPATGRVLGMANVPSYDPNAYGEVADIGVFRNAAVASQYELGSVFKPITMAIGLNEKVITPDTTYTDTGQVVFGSYVISNFDGKAHGVNTMTQVLEHSLNTGVVFVEQQLAKDTIRAYIRNFGFGATTGIDLAGEVAGNTSNLNKDKDLEFANASFGQGIAVTPLQLATAIAAIANGGTLMTPHVVDTIRYVDGSVEVITPHTVRRVITPATARQLTQMMVSTVEQGYDTVTIKDYFVAGKTGTAQIPDPERRGYSEDAIHSFVGFAPAYRPRFVVLLTMQRPQGIRFASESLAPVFSDVMSYLLTHYEVPPDIKNP
ncbi:MAG: penicillin-binding protein 2 [Patescibacteria group bacterium]